MVDHNLMVENARIGFRNFAGEEKKFNRAGDRNFCVFFDEKEGKRLEKEGWKIRWLKPRSEDDDPTGCLQVAMRFENYPPKVILVSSEGKTPLTEETVASLDYAELSNVDLVIRPYNWELSDGKKGTKAYLKSGYFTIEEDEFDKKYADVKARESKDSFEQIDEDVPF